MPKKVIVIIIIKEKCYISVRSRDIALKKCVFFNTLKFKVTVVVNQTYMDPAILSLVKLDLNHNLKTVLTSFFCNSVTISFSSI